MDRYTVEQVNRAQAQEELLRRVGRGERFETVAEDLGLSLGRAYLPRLRRRYEQGGYCWQALVDHRHGHPGKVTAERRRWLCEQKRRFPALTQEELAQRFEAEFTVSISQRQVGNVLREGGVALPGGRRWPSGGEDALPVERAGVFFPPGRPDSDGGIEHGDCRGPGAASRLSGA